MPTPAHSRPDTSHSGRTHKAGPSSSAAAAFVPVPAVVVVPKNEFQQASATPVLELDVVVASHSASVIEAAFELGPEAGLEAAAGNAVTVAAVGLESAVGFGADSEFEFVPAEGQPLPVEAVPGDSMMPSDCPVPDMAASTPSGVAVVGPVVLVVMEAVPGAEAAIGIALPHKRNFGLDWRAGQDAAVYKQPWHPGTRRIPPGHIRLCSTHRLVAGRQADHNQGLAVREHATRGAGTQTAVAGKADAVVHRIHYDVQGSLPSSGQILCALSQSSHSSTLSQHASGCTYQSA